MLATMDMIRDYDNRYHASDNSSSISQPLDQNNNGNRPMYAELSKPQSDLVHHPPTPTHSQPSPVSPSSRDGQDRRRSSVGTQVPQPRQESESQPSQHLNNGRMPVAPAAYYYYGGRPVISSSHQQQPPVLHNLSTISPPLEGSEGQYRADRSLPLPPPQQNSNFQNQFPPPPRHEEGPQVGALNHGRNLLSMPHPQAYYHFDSNATTMPPQQGIPVGQISQSMMGPPLGTLPLPTTSASQGSGAVIPSGSSSSHGGHFTSAGAPGAPPNQPPMVMLGMGHPPHIHNGHVLYPSQSHVGGMVPVGSPNANQAQAPPSHLMTTFNSKLSMKLSKKHVCNLCGKPFTRPSSLQTHMYSHTGEKPFKCDYEGCGRQFSVVSNLRRHKKIHGIYS